MCHFALSTVSKYHGLDLAEKSLDIVGSNRKLARAMMSCLCAYKSFKKMLEKGVFAYTQKPTESGNAAA